MTTTYSSEHRRLAPVLELACKMDIGINPEQDAIFDPGMGGFAIWCTPQDNPGGKWKDVQDMMDAGAFTKPCEWVASAIWGWTETPDGPVVDHLVLTTTAYALNQPGSPRHNHSDDVAWAKTKIKWLFERAGVPCPEIQVDGRAV